MEYSVHSCPYPCSGRSKGNRSRMLGKGSARKPDSRAGSEESHGSSSGGSDGEEDGVQVGGVSGQVAASQPVQFDERTFYFTQLSWEGFLCRGGKVGANLGLQLSLCDVCLPSTSAAAPRGMRANGSVM